MSWETVGAFLLIVGGGLAGVWQFIKSKAPAAKDLVDQVIDRLQGDSETSVPSRLEALEHVEALTRYLESKNNTAGIEALQIVVYEVLTLKKG